MNRGRADTCEPIADAEQARRRLQPGDLIDRLPALSQDTERLVEIVRGRMAWQT